MPNTPTPSPPELAMPPTVGGSAGRPPSSPDSSPTAPQSPRRTDSPRTTAERLHAAGGAPSAVSPFTSPTDGAFLALPHLAATAAGGWPSLTEYEIRGELGRGGMGVVYKAWDVRLQRWVAIKMLLDAELAQEDALARFRIEAQAAARLQHPNIVPIYEVGEWQGRPFLVMQYVDGIPLAKASAGQVQHPRATAELVSALARAMDHAHWHGVLHRDLKPANVLLTHGDPQSAGRQSRDWLTPDGWKLTATPKITDFGLAKLYHSPDSATAPVEAPGRTPTQTGTLIGTPQYMAPEQATFHGILTPAVDIYALGVILHELLTGKRPFDGYDLLDVLWQVRTQDPLPLHQLQPRVPRDLETICLKCLAKEPARRYLTAGALADDLDRYLRGEPIQARPVSAVEKAYRWVRRHPARAVMWMALILACSVSLGIYLAYSSHLAHANIQLNKSLSQEAAQRRRAEQERARADANFREARSVVDKYHVQIADAEEFKEPAAAPLRERLLTQALTYYERFLRERGQDPSLRREIGMTQERIARLHHELGKLDQAMAAAVQGRDLLARLQQEEPDHPDTRRQLGKLWRTVGWLELRQGKLAQARRSLETALAWQAPVVQSQPGDVELLREIALTCQNRAVTEIQAGDLRSGAAALAQAREFYDRCVQGKPNDPLLQGSLAGVLHDEGVMRRHQGDTQTCLANLRRAVALQEGVVRARPKSRQAARQLTMHYTELSSTYFQMRDLTAALEYQTKAVEQARANAKPVTTPQPELFHQLGVTLNNRGNVHQARGRTQEARRDFEEAVQHQRAAVAQAPGEVVFQHALALQLLELHNVDKELQLFTPAEHTLQEALEVLTKLTAQSPDMHFANTHAEAFLYLAKLRAAQNRTAEMEEAYSKHMEAKERLLQKHPIAFFKVDYYLAPMWHAGECLKRGDRARAMEDYRLVIRLIGELSEPQNRELYNLACCHARCAELLRHNVPTESDEHVKQALQHLLRALQAGFSIEQARADEDFSFLHTRWEFWWLLERQEMQQKAKK